jgi:hypothetical protein
LQKSFGNPLIVVENCVFWWKTVKVIRSIFSFGYDHKTNANPTKDLAYNSWCGFPTSLIWIENKDMTSWWPIPKESKGVAI